MLAQCLYRHGYRSLNQAAGRPTGVRRYLLLLILKTMISFIIHTLTSFPRWKEYTAALLAFAAFLAWPSVSRRIDLTSAPIDPGVMSAVLMAVFATLVFVLLAWWLLRNLLPVLGNYIDRQFDFHFKRLRSCQKVIVSLGFFVCLLFAFVATLAALF